MLYSLFSINLTIRISVLPLAKPIVAVDLPCFVSDPEAAIMRILALMENVCNFAGNCVTRAPRALRPVQPTHVRTNSYTTQSKTYTRRFLNSDLRMSLQKPSCVGSVLCTIGSSRSLCSLYWPECAGGSCCAIPRKIADVFHQC